MGEKNCSLYDSDDPKINSYVESVLGPRCPDPSVSKVTVIIYAVILVLGLAGNSLTCLVIARDKHMRTVTNYYLFSLAVSDLLSLMLGLPFELYHTETVEYPYIMPEFVCQMRAFISEMTSYASILILTAFSVERWLAICFPMRFRGFSKFSRATKIIGAVWTMSVLCASPQVFLFRVTPLLYPSDFNHTSSSTETFIANTEYCDASEVYAHLHQAIINISFWLFFVIPMILVLGMYSHIGLCIRAANKRHLEDAESRKHHCNDPGKRKSVIKMLVSVVAAFFICWLPFHLQRILSVSVSMESYSQNPFVRDLLEKIFYISGYFYYSNAAINPVLYNISNERFRESFRRSLCCCVKPVNTDSKSGVKTTENDAVESKNFRPSHSLVADKLAAGKALQVIVDHGYQSTVVVVSSDEERASESGKLREEVVVYV